MTPYVELQKQVIAGLRSLKEQDQGYLRRLSAGVFQENKADAKKASIILCKAAGVMLSGESWELEALAGIIQEQILDDGETITIKNILGRPVFDYGRTDDFTEALEHRGQGMNVLRTPRLAQPRVIKKGDILATGERVISEPRDGGNGIILIHLAGGSHGTWIGVPARIPIALLTPDDKVPPGYIES